MITCFWTNLSNLLIHQRRQYANDRGVNAGGNVFPAGIDAHNLPEVQNEATPPVNGRDEQRGLYPNINASRIVEIPAFAGQRD